MKNLRRYILLLLSSLICITYSSKSQEFLSALRKEHKGDATFADMQRAFDNWAKDKDLSKTKGWKWYKRWEDYNTKRVYADGSLPSASVYAKEAGKVMEWKRTDVEKKSGKSSWTPVGPNTLPITYDTSMETGIGRINCMAFHPTDPNTLWVGIAQGGVWKTTNHGNTWMPLTDDLPILRISDIAVDPLHPDTIYISVGDYAYLGISLELDNRKRNTHYGLGVYKTTDGGNNWYATGLSFSQTGFDGSLIRRVFVSPSNSNHLVAAGTSGIWNSTDGGTNWSQVSNSLIWDIEKDPVNANILYASTGFVNTMQAGSAGIIKSVNFGNSWSSLNTGIPAQNAAQRVEIAISPSDHNYVYAVACDLNGGLYAFYRSTDGGANWSAQTNYPNILEWYDGSVSGGQGTYDLAILVDPNDKDKVYVGGINMWETTDGGVSWDGVSFWMNYCGPSLHADQHFFAYNSLNSRYYVCNDGGIYYTNNIALGSWYDAYYTPGYLWPTTWAKISDGLVVTSFYRLGLCKNYANYVIGGAQDNSTYFYNTNNWLNVVGGDGMECIIHPANPSILYGSFQYGNIFKSTDGGLSFYELNVTNKPAGEWTTPYVLHPSIPGTLFVGKGDLWKSTNGGNTWSSISQFTNMQGASYPSPASALAVSPSDPNYIYLSKRIYHSYNQPSEMWKTTDGGNTWQDITNGLPDSIYITYITVDDIDKNTVWATFGGFYNGLKVFKTTDGGSNWINISGNLPNLPVNCIVHHGGLSHNPIYIGMDIGVYYISDTVANWQLYSNNLPNVIVSELEIHYSTEKLYVATFGRGIWMIDLFDKITSVRENNALNNLEVILFPNPNHGTFDVHFNNINVKEAKMEIIDITGRRVYNEQLTLQNKSFFKHYNLGLKYGMYFLNINYKNSTISKKFCVE